MKSVTQLAALAAVLAPLAISASSHAAATVDIVVVREHGLTGASTAQPYIDKLMAHIGKSAGWGTATGKYQATRAEADTYIKSSKPKFGIYSLAAFLAGKSTHKFETIGKVTSSQAGGGQYWIVTITAADLAGCKGKSLATEHADDTKFIDKVVFEGKFKVADFKLDTTTRPLQAMQKVNKGEAVCALIDDAQYAQLKKQVPSAREVWKSAQLPGMAVVAFSSASDAEKKDLKAALPKTCQGDGKDPCAQVGLTSVQAASDADYQTVINLYK